VLVPMEWLKEYVQTKWSDEEIANRLTMAGVSVKNIIMPPIKGKILSAIVKKVYKHPHSDKLHVCELFDGTGLYRTVTSDMNVNEGSVVAVAMPGTVLVNGSVVESVSIKGVLSEVMMCSLQELGLETKSEHVYQIEEDIPLGEDLIRYWKLDDKTMEVEITPNRPDCLGIIGVARELATLCDGTLQQPDMIFDAADNHVEDFVKVTIEDLDGCPRYCAGFMESVEIRPSPIWLRRRLINAGIRPINNVVDISNYVMLETGHPVHIFDYSKVIDGHIIVRKAIKGEEVKLLDEKTYALNGIETLIADKEKILAVGGIMGSSQSGVSDLTKDIILEVAYFNPVRIRRSSKALNIKSDASYRFERGVDPNDALMVMKRLVNLIEKIAYGKATQGFVDVYPRKITSKYVTLRKSRLSKVLGVTVEDETVQKILSSLGMKVEDMQDRWHVEIPTFRPDVSIEEDLIEEIGRIHGYEKITQQIPKVSASGKGWSDLNTFRKTIRQLLIGSGFDETVSLSFASSKVVKQSMNVEPLRLKNPMTEDMDCLRPSLVFGLIDSLSHNAKRQIKDVKFFEIAKVYNLENRTPVEREKIGVIMTGQLNEEDYTDHRFVSMLNLKGVLDELSHHLSVDLQVDPAQIDWLTPGRSGYVQLENETVGIMGMLNSKFNQIYDIKGEIYYMELDLEKIFTKSKTVKELKEISSFPAVRRDISLLIPVGFSSKQILSFFEKSNEYVEKVGVSDVYKGKDIPQDMVSVTFYVIYRASDRSLTDDEVNAVFEGTVSDIEKQFNVKRRFM